MASAVMRLNSRVYHAAIIECCSPLAAALDGKRSLLVETILKESWGHGTLEAVPFQSYSSFWPVFDSAARSIRYTRSTGKPTTLK